MPRIVENYLIRLNTSYRVLVIEDEERLWVNLFIPGSRRLLEFWSTKKGESEVAPYKTLITELERRLTLVEHEHVHEIDALTFWPKGWDYWGLGTPAPLERYLESEEYREATSI